MNLRAPIVLTLFATLALPHAAGAEEGAPLPETAVAYAHAPLAPVGSGKYRKLGFSIYNATLWGMKGAFERNKPFALQLIYARDLSKETVAGALIDNIRDEGVADEATLTRWQKLFNDKLSEVHENDELVAVSVPGKECHLFFNGKLLTTIKEQALNDAFFDIWLGKTANETLQAKLLGKV